MKALTALERIKKIEKRNEVWDKAEPGSIIVVDDPKEPMANLLARDNLYLLKAFQVMREIAIELSDRHLYRMFLAKQIRREDLKRSEEMVDRSFNITFSMKEKT